MAHACQVCSFYPVPDGEGVACSHCHRRQYGTTCPHCKQQAPTRVRDFRVFCTACDHERGPLSGGITMPLDMVGKPSQYGGIAAKVIGTIVLLISLAIVALTATAAVAWSSAILGTLAFLLALVGGTASTLLLRGGAKLQKQGVTAERTAREQSLTAAARNRGGLITVNEAAKVLNVPPAEADALLTELAREGTRVHVEVDGQGVLQFVFHEAAPVHVAPSMGPQVTGVRVATDGAQTSPPSAADPVEAARARVDREFEALKQTRAAREDKS
ncbi:MAG: hypothetical protein Q8Q09_22970 [Deltaproteobacteria bacterium]|nr:hypothetical protein [Deltaproteobacteria bacterium]